MKTQFSEESLNQLFDWEETDKKIFKKIKTLIKETKRTPYEGTGKPEPLKHELTGWWSRHINDEHRLTYKVEDDMLYIKSCKGHYE